MKLQLAGARDSLSALLKNDQGRFFLRSLDLVDPQEGGDEKVRLVDSPMPQGGMDADTYLAALMSKWNFWPIAGDVTYYVEDGEMPVIDQEEPGEEGFAVSGFINCRTGVEIPLMERRLQ